MAGPAVIIAAILVYTRVKRRSKISTTIFLHVLLVAIYKLHPQYTWYLFIKQINLTLDTRK